MNKIYEVMMVHAYMTRREFDEFYFVEGNRRHTWNEFFKSVYQFAIEKRDAEIVFICKNWDEFKKKKELTHLEYDMQVKKRSYTRLLDHYKLAEANYKIDRSEIKKAAYKAADSDKKKAYAEYKTAKSAYDVARSNLSDEVFNFARMAHIVKTDEFATPTQAMHCLMSKATIMCKAATHRHLGQMVSDYNAKESYVSDAFMLEDSVLPATVECRVNRQANEAEVYIRTIVRVDENTEEPPYDKNPNVINRLFARADAEKDSELSTDSNS